jgi:hypothetical protein
LKQSNLVSLGEEDTPDSFSFKTVDGETMEAAVICWQHLNAVAFATEEKCYMTNDQYLNQFTGAFVKGVSDNTRWGMSLAGWFSSTRIDDECISDVFAHFLLNDASNSPSVGKVQAVLLQKSMPFLRGLSYLATATAFGDAETAQELMRQLKAA